MEKIKEFFSSPKKTAILGLIGSIVWVLANLINSVEKGFSSFSSIAIGYNIYFSITLLRLYKGKGNIELAKKLLIVSYIINIVINFVMIGIVAGNFILAIISLIPNGIILLYLLNILFGKFKIINNKVYIIPTILTFILFILYLVQLEKYVEEIILRAMECFGSIATVPYFYNYYELLKGGK